MFAPEEIRLARDARTLKRLVAFAALQRALDRSRTCSTHDRSTCPMRQLLPHHEQRGDDELDR
jgi:hypothetical protein